jgi:acetyl esterase/lipase
MTIPQLHRSAVVQWSSGYQEFDRTAHENPDPFCRAFAQPTHPVPQPDPATLAKAETVELGEPAPPPAKNIGWGKPADGVQTESDVVIGTGGGRPLHAELAYPKIPTKTPMPAIVWIHGGAWQGDSEKPNKMMYFATQGYFVASIEYRLAKEAKWPAQIQDCKLGIRWVRANAAKYNVDPDHIGVVGESAGGHLASCVGTLDDPAMEGDGGFPGVSSKVQAVCDWYGPVDFRNGGPEVLFGVPFSQNPAVYLSASPYVHIKPTNPPFLVIHGDADYTVPYKESVNFVAAMIDAGAPVQFMTIHNGMHGFGAVPGGPKPTVGLDQIFARMTVFFDAHLKK